MEDDNYYRDLVEAVGPAVALKLQVMEMRNDSQIVIEEMRRVRREIG